MVEALGQNFGETRRATGITGNTLLEVWVSPEGTWTIIATSTGGISCVVASGHDYDETDIPEGDPT
jgi:hypothetical protein